MRRFIPLLAIIATGCERDPQVSDCRKLVGQLSSSSRLIRSGAGEAGAADSTGASEMRRVAREYATLAERLDGLDLETAELKQHRAQYSELARRAATIAGDASEAASKYDHGSVSSAKKKLDATVTDERALVAKINGTCGKR